MNIFKSVARNHEAIGLVSERRRHEDDRQKIERIKNTGVDRQRRTRSEFPQSVDAC